LSVAPARATRAAPAEEAPSCRELGREAAQHGLLCVWSAFTEPCAAGFGRSRPRRRAPSSLAPAPRTLYPFSLPPLAVVLSSVCATLIAADSFGAMLCSSESNERDSVRPGSRLRSPVSSGSERFRDRRLSLLPPRQLSVPILLLSRVQRSMLVPHLLSSQEGFPHPTAHLP